MITATLLAEDRSPAVAQDADSLTNEQLRLAIQDLLGDIVRCSHRGALRNGAGDRLVVFREDLYIQAKQLLDLAKQANPLDPLEEQAKWTILVRTFEGGYNFNHIGVCMGCREYGQLNSFDLCEPCQK